MHYLLSYAYIYIKELLVRGLGASLTAAGARRHLSTEMTLPTHEFLSYNYVGSGMGTTTTAAVVAMTGSESQADPYNESDELVLSTREVYIFTYMNV